MKVLLTGAMGNIGFSTLEALLVEGHDVVAFDLESRRARRLASGLDGRVHVVWGDITDPESLRYALDGVDAVIHLAAIIPPYSERAPDLAQKVNFDATRSLIAQMEASPTAKRLVVRIVRRRHRRRPGSRATATCRHARLSDRRVRATEGGVRAGDPAVAAAVEHPAACGCDADPLAGAGPQHHVRVQPRRAVRVPPSRRRRDGIRSCSWPVRGRSQRRST